MSSLKVEVYDKIRKPVTEVFSAIVEPHKLSGFFTSKASDIITTGENLTWCFEDVQAIIDVKVLIVKKNELISLEWAASGKKTVVDIMLTAKKDNLTEIKIIESDFEYTEKEVKMAMRQTQGWTDFICSMKAYLYSGLNIRSGQIIT
ncbi:MAG: ATPase [Melioribacteraceae bacterium]|nr:MAG: ATPase [Melioribacteraceae bacterium]